MSKILNTLTAIALLSLPVLAYKACSNKSDEFLNLNNERYAVTREDDGIRVREIGNVIGESSEWYDRGFDGVLDKYTLSKFYPGHLRINSILEAESNLEAIGAASVGRFAPIERILEEGEEFEKQAEFYRTHIFPLLSKNN